MSNSYDTICNILGIVSLISSSHYSFDSMFVQITDQKLSKKEEGNDLVCQYEAGLYLLLIENIFCISIIRHSQLWVHLF